MKRMTTILVIVGLAMMLSGCERQRWLEAEPGTYVAIRGSDNASTDAARELHSLTVNRRTNDLLLVFENGSEQVVPFATRERETWPAGCPTSLVQHRMEVLDLEIDTIYIGEWRAEHPILVRNCPTEPEELVLREEGSVGGGGNAITRSCLVFSQ